MCGSQNIILFHNVVLLDTQIQTIDCGWKYLCELTWFSVAISVFPNFCVKQCFVLCYVIHPVNSHSINYYKCIFLLYALWLWHFLKHLNMSFHSLLPIAYCDIIARLLKFPRQRWRYSSDVDKIGNYKAVFIGLLLFYCCC